MTVSHRARVSRRVYTTTFLVMAAVLTLLASGAAAAGPDVTVAPTMTKGAPTARVTIVEFSDYQ